jgi:hypothetical protein
MMKNIYKTIILLIFALGLSSCNDWLDVMPQGDAKADNLLTNTQGYNSALGGVYYQLIQSDMYAGNMSFTAIDAMAQYWNINSNNHEMYYFTQYDYENLKIKYQINNWWKNYYVGIAQCNQILKTLEGNREQIDTPELFEAELLTLRAFMHLQLYRLFGPVVQNDSDLDQTAISYRTKYDNIATKFMTCREVLNKAKKDLTKALGLFKNDPIKSNHKRNDYNVSRLNYNNILLNRTARMNYYTVLGLLGRVEQLILNQSETDGALYWANRLIEEVKSNKSIYLAVKSDVSGDSNETRDLMYSSEIVSSFYINNLYEKAGTIFGLPDYTTKVNQHIIISEQDFANFVKFVYGRIPDGSGKDYRLNYWFNRNSGNQYPFQKYKKPINLGTTYPISYPEIAIYRLSEAYYTKCEALIGINDIEALNTLNIVRSARGLEKLPNSEAGNVMEYLMRERRKEFIGEGRMFFIYKRLFKDIEISEGKTIRASKAIFELPIPKDEFTYGPNNQGNN